MSQVIADLKWRYATKKYDASKKVSDSDFATLLEGLQLSASSYGLQPYKFINVVDPEVRAKLQPASWGQTQIVDASHLIVFAADTDVTAENIDALLELTASTRGIPVDALSGYGDFMKSAIGAMPTEIKPTWNSKQTYIALGNLMNLAASMKIDTTPIEGFDAKQYDEILGLAEKGLTSAVVCAIGYRSEEDETAAAAKVRKPLSDLVITV